MRIPLKGLLRSLPNSPARHINRQRFLLTSFAVLACLSLLLFSGPWNAQARTRKAPRAVSRHKSTHKRKILAKSLAAKDRDGAQSAEPTAGPEDDPEARQKWFWFQRTYPFNEIPLGARSRAWESVAQSEKGFRSLAVGTVWSSIGPTPTTSAFPNNGGFTSGRINTIAVSPANNQIVLVGSATGGIWRSIDGGTTFTPVSDNQVDLAVGAIAFAPSNANIVYAGMGDNDNGYFGTGVLKSTDAGATWTRINNNTFPDRGQCVKVAVDPNDSSRVYVAQFNSLNPANGGTFVSGIHASIDGGVNWTNILAGSASDFAIHPTNPQILYAGIRFSFDQTPSQGLYKSINGGTTWNKVYDSPFNAGQSSTREFRVAVTPASPNRVYIYFGTRETTPNSVRLEMSDDAGATFTNRGTISNNAGGIDPGQFGYNTYLTASPVDANTVYVGSRDVFRSTDGGVTFTDISTAFAPPWPNGAYTPDNQKFHSDQQSFAFQPASGSTFYCGGDGGVWKTTDSGANFTSLNATLSLTQFVSIGVSPTDATKSYGGTQDNGTQRRTAGSGWAEFSGGDGGKLVVDPVDPKRVYSSYVSGVMSRYLNNGATFDGQIANAGSFGEPVPPAAARIAFYPPIVGNGVDSKIYVGTWRLFICTDCNDSLRDLGSTPATWTPPGGTFDQTNGGSDVLSALAVARSNNQVIYSGSRAGRAMVSINGGANWTDITTGLPNRSIPSITVSPTDPTLVYLTVSGYGTGHVFRSTNSGTNWTDISNNLPNIPTSAFLIDPLTPTTLYAGTDIGVFRSTDNGGSWTVFNNGLPPVPVMAFSAQTGGLIQIGTYGRGAYELPTTGAPPPSPTPTPSPSPSPSPSPTPNANTVQFNAANFPVGEAAGSVVLTVTRTGATNVASTVDFATDAGAPLASCAQSNGIASERCDYTMALGTVQFAANETSKTVTVFITDDVYTEVIETFTVTLSNPTGGFALGTPGTATVTITDNDGASGQSPVKNGASFSNAFFVRQQYIDFLNREPDAGGLGFWKNQLDECEGMTLPAGFTDAQNCREVRRINVSAAFFLSIEFQNTGFLVYRFNQAAFNLNAELQFRSFLKDTQGIQRGVIVGQGNWQQQIEDNKVAFANSFVTRPDFIAAFPANMTAAAFVDALNANTKDPRNPTTPSLTQAERDNLVAMLNPNPSNAALRAQVLRSIAENSVFQQRESPRAFVLLQYYGYLRRNPNATPDSDFGGYNFWLGKLNQFGGNFVNSEMVKGFITSGEYVNRFGL